MLKTGPGPVFNMRLDKKLKAENQDLSWRQIREAVEKGQVTVDGQVQKDPGLEVYPASRIEMNRNRPAQSTARAGFEVLYEDDTIIVLNKPAGLLSIPSNPEAGSSEDTVLRRVREYMLFKLGHKSYVGMLHRLDRDTSGSLAVALSKDAHAAGREMFKEHLFERHYLALVQGIPEKPSGTIEARISSGYRDGRRILVDADRSGLDSTTDYRVRERLKNAALLELRLHTGRQHQIRLHLEKLGHPLIGERVYDAADGPWPREDGRPSVSTKRNMLHAWTLAFPHPLTGEPISVEAPLPPDFVQTMKRLALVFLLSLLSIPAMAQSTVVSPDGRQQIAAVRTTSPIVIDGELSEEVWTRIVYNESQFTDITQPAGRGVVVKYTQMFAF